MKSKLCDGKIVIIEKRFIIKLLDDENQSPSILLEKDTNKYYVTDEECYVYGPFDTYQETLDFAILNYIIDKK